MILTSATAALYFDGFRVGKCRQVNLDVNRDALQTTKLGDIDRTFISGLRDTKGSATLFYDPTDPGVDTVLSRLFSDTGALSGFELSFDTEGDESITASVAITNAQLTASFGSAQTCEIQFQLSGKPLSRYTVTPAPPPPPSAVTKWMAYSTENEGWVNSHSIELDDQGNTYSFIANSTHSEVSKFSPIGEVLWTKKISSYNGQPAFGPSLDSPLSVKIGQTIHKINDNRFLICITDNGYRFHLIMIDSNGSVIYNRGYNIYPGLGTPRVLSIDRSKLLIAQGSATVFVVDTNTGTLVKRFGFSNQPFIIRSITPLPNGNWIIVANGYFVEVNSTFTSVAQAVAFADLSLNYVLTPRPDSSGYLCLGGGVIHHFDSGFNLVETRDFSGSSSGISYDANGDYYIWSTYTNFYQSLGMPGWPGLFTLVKYNWDNNYVHFITEANGDRAPCPAINKSVQRASYTQQGIQINGGGVTPVSYRCIKSINLIQPSATNGTPIFATNPPGFSLHARTVLNPAPGPTTISPIYTRFTAQLSLTDLALPEEKSSTFIVESVTRNFSLVYLSS